ncbi:hypothetical protein [Spirochaeta lutea]|uniref:Uncharacterized protein n=1 Tax=Spirochaeta lutea TaxID=1480694 RepID=A0A098R542_9SPIO|nr:hypothetical protein [Spirochaeta lutea]KGE73837.1 hypothetical protein DC28_01070 [Spirochaeta lutea]
MNPSNGRTPDDPRELIAEVYRQILALRESGTEPTRVLMPGSQFRQLQWYRWFLGESRAAVPDYLGEFELFSLPIYTSDIDKVTVE